MADSDYQDALHDGSPNRTRWRNVMLTAARRLQDVLGGQYDQRWCHVCNTQMTEGASAHILCRIHCMTVQRCLSTVEWNGDPATLRLPMQHIINVPGAKWIQIFSLSDGKYRFNHLTGQQSWDWDTTVRWPGRLRDPPPHWHVPMPLQCKALAWGAASVAPDWSYDDVCGARRNARTLCKDK